MSKFQLVDLTFNSKSDVVDFFNAEKETIAAGGGVVDRDIYRYLIAIFKLKKGWQRKIPNGSCFKEFKVIKNPVHPGYLYAAVHVDGTIFPFVIEKCLSEVSKRTAVSKVLRYEVGDQLRKFKKDFFDTYYESNFRYDDDGNRIPPKCPIEATPLNNRPGGCHVDHYYPQFAAIIDQFMFLVSITIADIEIEMGPNNIPWLADRKLADRWKKYHLNHAKLRVISAAANLKRSRTDIPVKMVSTTGFEPAASCAQGTRSTKLSYIEMLEGACSQDCNQQAVADGDSTDEDPDYL
jgi:hypothetical protein